MAALIRHLRLPPSPVETSVEARAFVFFAFAVAALAIVIYGGDYVVPLVAVIVSAIGHVASYRERNQRRGLWRQVLLAGLIFGALFYVIADSSLGLFGGTMPQANFAILLVAITSFDLKTRRNCYSSLWISLTIVYLAGVYAWDYEFAILLGLWVLYLFGFWIASHLKRIDAGARVPAVGVALLLAISLLGGIGLFVAVPQPAGVPISPLVVSLPNFTAFKSDLESAALPLVQVTGDSTGATTSVDLRFRGRLGDAPVMYVRTGAPAYWRGLIFDLYRDGVWTASDGSFRQTPAYVPSRLLPPPPTHVLGTFMQTFRVVRTLPGVINAAYPIESLYAPVSALREDAYGTFHTPEQLRPGQTYSVVSYIPDWTAQSLRADEDPALYPPAGRANLDIGSLSAQARSLARQRVAGKTNELDRVLALTDYLKSSYVYSLDLSPVPSGRDPVDWFLFDVKKGYCEQFATAETMMLRSLGIPARLVTGYSTGEYDPILNQAVVRERDAHAWVEVWFTGHGWVQIDPTPGVPALAATRFPNHWAGSGIAHLIPHVTFAAPAAGLGSIGALGMIPAAIAAAVIGVLALLWLRRRGWMRRGGSQPGESELLRLYERAQRKMRRRRAPPETPWEYQQAMQSDRLQDLTAAVNEGVYAGRWPSPERVRELAEAIF